MHVYIYIVYTCVHIYIYTHVHIQSYTYICISQISNHMKYAKYAPARRMSWFVLGFCLLFCILLKPHKIVVIPQQPDPGWFCGGLPIKDFQRWNSCNAER